MSLAGRRVVVTRPRARARELCAALSWRGAEVVPFPVIETVTATGGALARALAALEHYDWIALTSAAAVEAFAECRRERGDARAVRTRIAAVGPGTAAAARDAGLVVTATPAVHTGAALAGAMGPLAGRRVLLPASAIARPETAAALRAAGADVDVVAAYTTEPVTPEAAALRELGRGADAVTFTSPSTVSAFETVGGPAAQALLQGAVLACIGPTTAAAVRAIGLTPHVVPVVHSAPALADALDRHFAAAEPQESVR